MKKLLALLLAVMMVLSLAACAPAADSNETTAAAGNETTAAGDETTAAAAADLKVGAIYINSKNDTAGYTFAHHNGITTAMKELGLDPETQLFIVDEVAEDKQAVLDAVDTLVGEGAQIIFGISHLPLFC